MNIQIIAVGKIREKYIKEGISEFLKRIQPYSSVKVIEIDAEDLKHSPQKSMEVEGEKILNQISDSAYTIILDIPGKSLSSEQFAAKIKEINSEGINQLVFIIGGAVGLSENVKKKANFSLSLSNMTFPHQLVRLFLLEQVYRAFKIINNEPYHK
jgi:23S rRNA (pseudouridine1915-N3)-methyltransferase